VIYIICQIILAFWLVLTYDQLEDRRIDDVINIFLFLYYIKQIDSMFPCICSVVDHRRCQNVVRTSVTHSVITLCATFLFLPHLMSSVINYWTDAQQHGNYLLILQTEFVGKETEGSSDCQLILSNVLKLYVEVITANIVVQCTLLTLCCCKDLVESVSCFILTHGINFIMSQGFILC